MKLAPPVLTLMLVALWLVLNNTLDPGHIVFGRRAGGGAHDGGGALSTSAAATASPASGPAVCCDGAERHRALELRRRAHRAGSRCATVQVRSGFLDIPLELRDPHALAILAAIVTSTPGTAWAGLSPDGRTLTLHVLDLKDEAAWIQTIKDRYERPLMEDLRMNHRSSSTPWRSHRCVSCWRWCAPTIRLIRGPAAQDRVLALDTLYINGMLTLLMLGIRSGSTAYFDMALLIAVFGFVGSVALAKFLLRGEVIEP